VEYWGAKIFENTLSRFDTLPDRQNCDRQKDGQNCYNKIALCLASHTDARQWFADVESDLASGVQLLDEKNNKIQLNCPFRIHVCLHIASLENRVDMLMALFTRSVFTAAIR